LLSVTDDDDFVVSKDDRNLRSQLEDWLDTQIAELPNEMIVHNAFEARVAPHPFINFLNYVLLAKSGADIACTALFD
ncbi:bifunctional metallophosphatase/5'-nucleotidase, partial [Staphylococcus gallinarum]